MKKILVALVVVCIVAIAAVYILIPKTLVVEETVNLPCVPAAAFRNLSDESNWKKWWPSAGVPDDVKVPAGAYLFSNNQYSLSKKGINILQVLIGDQKDSLSSEIHLLAIPTDSTIVRWKLDIDAGSNPFSRISEYRRAVSLKKDMHTILKSIQAHLSDINNVYGVTFHEGPVTDTLLITTKSTVAELPSVDYVYSRINKLKDFCSRENCRVTGTPMLNITPLHPAGYRVMVALPIDRFMQPKNSADSIEGVKLVGRKFIIADVTGGEQKVAFIHQQMRFYFQDYGRMLMAIPFDYLITDRQKETDTSKWKTKIYAPVF